MNPILPFHIQQGNIYAVPVLHYRMEFAVHVHQLCQALQPDCIAVELPETMQLQLLHGASRLPDISVIHTSPLYILCEPCDPGFEALRFALEQQIPAHCIDLDVENYPSIQEPFPDPYAITRIGLQAYYELYEKTKNGLHQPKLKLDQERELHMGKRLKELSLSHEKVLFIGGMSHIKGVLECIKHTQFPILHHAERPTTQLATLTEQSCRDVMAEFGWMTKSYEHFREESSEAPDRQLIIFQLFKTAAKQYITATGFDFPGYNHRNLMKYLRNLCRLNEQLMPDLYQILTAAKGCVDHTYAYHTWELATDYPYRKNIDALEELDLSPEDIWGASKWIKFHIKHPRRKGFSFHRKNRQKGNYRFEPPGPFTICSYPPEDLVIEDFGQFLQKKGTQLFSEEGAQTRPFSSSLEDGIDTRETIRHWTEKKLFVKIKGKPPKGVGSVVVVFDQDLENRYPWKTTWLGEHEQESDMALYATAMGSEVVGPGICRCRYGGFMMSYPPRRMFDVWRDPDYAECTSKAEVLLMAAIDYAVKPVVVYVADTPPKPFLKQFAQRFGKKIIYIPIGQLSRIKLQEIRIFHVLDGHNKREIADDYIR